MTAAVVLSVFVYLALAPSAPAADWSVADCRSCHTTYPAAHSLDNCLECHGTYQWWLDPGAGHYYTIDRPAGSCVNGGSCHTSGFLIGEDTYAHGYWLGWDDPPGPYDYYPESPISHYSNKSNGIWSNRVYSCGYCHSASYPYIYRHDPTALEAAHLSDIANTSCESCHSNQLADEPGHIACDTCHASADPAVIDAIGASDTSCGACHEYDHVALHDEALTDPDCLTCHESNASAEHGDDCALCHESADPVVIAAIDARDTGCDACHDIGAGHVALHDSAGANGSCVGSGCHGANLVTEHGGECAPCHDSTAWYVVAAVEAGNLSCTACHTLYHYKGSSPDPYMSWAAAESSMQLRGVDSGGSPHGGYTAHTTKCAVCHSAHRAASDRTEDGVGSYWKLTQGGNSCTACHTPGGSNPTSTMVEWPSAYTDGGPHRSFQCMGQCHAGVHGAIVSEYDTAARFLLNPNRRPENTEMGGYGLDDGLAAALAAGNVGGGVSEETLRNGVPTKATRAMVTGYLCGQAGCHTSSQFAVNAAGYAEMRVSMPSDPYGPYDTAFTGHNTGATRSSCSSSGCHAVPYETGDSNCATCHDFRGRATGSTAWPHANRGIEVYEWVRPESVLETRFTGVTAGNLWMYSGDVTYRDANGEPTATPMWDGAPMQDPNVTVAGFRSDRINTRTVLQGNSSFDEGNDKPGNIRDGVCLKCHGYVFWPTHGGTAGDPLTGGYHGDTSNFARY